MMDIWHIVGVHYIFVPLFLLFFLPLPGMQTVRCFTHCDPVGESERVITMNKRTCEFSSHEGEVRSWCMFLEDVLALVN